MLIVGGGASGFFTAINIAEKCPGFHVSIIEKSKSLLGKVRVSGGGRCNITNGRSKPAELVKFYPRGNKKLHQPLSVFGTAHMQEWLRLRGVRLKTENDLRVFPVSNSSETIIECFTSACVKYDVDIRTSEHLIDFYKKDNKWCILTSMGKYEVDLLILATGSSPGIWKLLSTKGLEVVAPVPSLFTFNIDDDRIKHLQGISFDHVQTQLIGSKLKSEGPLLITHWGLSGPAILKLSAWGAVELEKASYQFSILINYLNLPEQAAREMLNSFIQSNPNRSVYKYPLWNLPRRFWIQLLTICDVPEGFTFQSLGKRQKNKLLEELLQGRYQVNGKSTFKEEFVTAGGISLAEIDLKTFECRKHAGLYLAGELLNIDGLTGGFNFQACWTAGWQISEDIAHQYGE